MATFEITEGAPGQGKSLYTAKLTERIIKRNAKWNIRGNPIRKIWSNIKFASWFEEEYAEFIEYWTDSEVLVKLRDCDIIWDEIATELDARNWVNLSVEMKRFLSQYRKRGIDIFANTQDFSMIDARARLMISNVRTLSKIIGSSDISTTKPPPKYIWGVVMIREVENFRETNPEKKKYGMIPSFMTIDRSSVNIYDTRQDIKQGELPKLKHEVRYCEFYGIKGHDCENHKKIIHQ
jgi:hypothetical protein